MRKGKGILPDESGTTKAKKIRLRKAILKAAADILGDPKAKRSEKALIIKTMAPYVLKSNEHILRESKEERKNEQTALKKQAKSEAKEKVKAERAEQKIKEKKKAKEKKTAVAVPAQPVGLKKQRQEEANAVASGATPSRWAGVAQQSAN